MLESNDTQEREPAVAGAGSRSALESNDDVARRYTPVPGVRRVKQAMVKNEANRTAVTWGTADSTRLSSAQLDGVHTVVSSLLYAESHGNDVCSNLICHVPYADISDAFAVQVLDESHHAWMLTRYLKQELRRPIIRRPLVPWLIVEQLKLIHDPLLCALSASFFIECAAAEVQAEIIRKVDEPLLVEIFRTISRDESRHIALGREVVAFLLDDPAQRRGWRRIRNRVFRDFLRLSAERTFHHYAPLAKLFGIDVPRALRHTMERLDGAVGL